MTQCKAPIYEESYLPKYPPSPFSWGGKGNQATDGHHSCHHLCGSRRVETAFPNAVSTSPVSKSEFCEARSRRITKTKMEVLQICIVLCHPLRQHPQFIIFCVLTLMELTSFDNIPSFPNSCYVFWNSALHTGSLDFFHFITFIQTGLFPNHFFWRSPMMDMCSSDLSINNELLVTSACRGLDFNHFFTNTPSFHCLFIFILPIGWTHYHRWM